MSDLPPPQSGTETSPSVEPPADPAEARAPESEPLDESTAARTVYLYAVLLLSMIGVIAGGLIVTTSVVHVIEPDTGHRDALDRAAVGLAEVGRDGIEIARGFLDAESPTLEEFCGSDMAADCVEFYGEEFGSEAVDITDTLDDILDSIQSETDRQIRLTSIGWLLVGLVLLAMSLLSFRYHARKSALYRKDGAEA